MAISFRCPAYSSRSFSHHNVLCSWYERSPLFPGIMSLKDVNAETPRFLTTKKVGLSTQHCLLILYRVLTCTQRYEEAETTLSWLRKLPVDHDYVRWELKQMREQVESEDLIKDNVNTWESLKELTRSKEHRTRLILGVVLLVSTVGGIGTQR